MPLSDEELRELIRSLSSRPGHESLRSSTQSLLVLGLGAPANQIKHEHKLPEVHGRADALLGRTVFEFKSDLRNETGDAEEELGRYLKQRESETGHRYVGVATDGADFFTYEIRSGKLARLRAQFSVRGELARKREAADVGHALMAWLSPLVTLAPELSPDPHTVRQELGRESVVYEVARSRLEAVWKEVSSRPDVVLKRQLWAERLRLVYGDTVDDDALFFQHTYLTIVAKTMATLALHVELPQPEDLLSGRSFQQAGINGVVESDFFDWVLAAGDSADLVHRISAQVARFRLGDIRHDVLKGLYESLIDPEQRHDLGEYYTPDWLAQWMCERVIERPLKSRVLDPSCGSGTFLFHAVRRFLDAAARSGIANREALKRCTEAIFGIDVHPVAVINARVTYLLAIGEERLRDRPPLNIPVYLGDSMQWNTEQVMMGQTVRITVPPMGKDELDNPRNVPNLTFPFRVASNPSLFDSVINQMLSLSEQNAPPAALEGWIERQASEEIPAELRKTLATTYSNLRKLRREGRNHIWGYVARNLSRPVWLSSEGQKVDVLIGNPPWLAYRDMSDEMQKLLKAECQARGLWAGGKVATHQDLSAYFFARCLELYLKKNGAIAFVMPLATMTRQQYRGFRGGVFAGRIKGRAIRIYASARFADAWVFDESVQPLFNVPSCVLFAHEGQAAELPTSVRQYSGELPRRDASASEAAERLTYRQVPWPRGNESGTGGYSARFRQGATVVPRVLFLVERVTAGRLGSNPEAPIVQSRRSNLEKAPWRDLEPLRGSVEKEFLKPLYLGESIAPFRLLKPAEAVIPWSAKSARLLDAASARNSGYSGLAEWLRQAETIWGQHRRRKISLTEQLDFYGKLSAQMPAPELRVIYSASGTNPAAAILKDSAAVIEHSLYWSGTERIEDASYLTAILNSEALRMKIASRQAKGQWGARHFDKLLAEAIPPFDESDAIHLRLAAEAQRAEQIAAAVALPDNLHFIRARSIIRDVLRRDGVAARIDALVERILSAQDRAISIS
ncbi:MAG: Eco57I restriction-modification methylase domain-containing protein [Candidatus Binataceae bacterium]